MPQVPGFSSSRGADETFANGDHSPLGTYEDPQTGVRETATHEAHADAFIRMGWKKTAKDDKIVSSREQILGALDMDTSKAEIGTGPDDGVAVSATSQENFDDNRRAAQDAAKESK